MNSRLHSGYQWVPVSLMNLFCYLYIITMHIALEIFVSNPIPIFPGFQDFHFAVLGQIARHIKVLPCTASYIQNFGCYNAGTVQRLFQNKTVLPDKAGQAIRSDSVPFTGHSQHFRSGIRSQGADDRILVSCAALYVPVICRNAGAVFQNKTVLPDKTGQAFRSDLIPFTGSFQHFHLRIAVQGTHNRILFSCTTPNI